MINNLVVTGAERRMDKATLYSRRFIQSWMNNGYSDAIELSDRLVRIFAICLATSNFGHRDVRKQMLCKVSSYIKLREGLPVEHRNSVPGTILRRR